MNAEGFEMVCAAYGATVLSVLPASPPPYGSGERLLSHLFAEM